MNSFHITVAILMIVLGFSIGHYVDYKIAEAEEQKINCIKGWYWLAYDFNQRDNVTKEVRKVVNEDWAWTCMTLDYTEKEWLDIGYELGWIKNE